MELDDMDGIKKVDKSDMLGMIFSLPDEMERILSQEMEFPVPEGEFDSVAICGMGGSAIGGDILKEWLAPTSSYPISVFRGYDLPVYVSGEWLVLAVSHSGNTEETINMFGTAVKRGCNVVGVSTGGRLQGMAVDAMGHVRVDAKPGVPPRAALGHMLVPMAMLLEHFGVGRVEKEIEETVEVLRYMRGELSPDVPEEKNLAKKVAQRLHNKLPVVHGYGPLGPAAKRWKTQLNENSKVVAWCDELPELDHNSVVGWSADGKGKEHATVFLRDSAMEKEHDGALARRVDATIDIIAERGIETVEAWSKGEGPLSRIMSLIYLGDFVSTYLAILRDVDPTPVDVIESLKKKLASK